MGNKVELKMKDIAVGNQQNRFPIMFMSSEPSTNLNMKIFAISFLFSVTLVGFVNSVYYSDVTQLMHDSGVDSNDIATNSVFGLLKITFDNNVIADMGNELTPTQTKNEPTLDWDADENEFYTILNLDPDAPGRDDPFNALLNTWMVGNIPGKDVKSGRAIFEYIPAATAKGRGLNRYVILVYKQPGILKFEEHPIDRYHFEGRQRFPFVKFVEKYDLGNPVAANYYRTQYDSFVLEVYEQLQCCFELNKD
ncbi:protein D3-like [Episyrphus balteatus]|uniref:protein D3-like n=1 Tax=Episyrphus balteatus TaxID=286459 RepID=UPI00248520F7|nr:protein D3-like [Episyrphus balteatus]